MVAFLFLIYVILEVELWYCVYLPLTSLKFTSKNLTDLCSVSQEI